MAGLLANAPTVHCILDSGQRTQYLSRLAPYPSHKPSIYPAWRPPANPGFIPLGACPQTQRLSRLAPACKPSIYPAWRLPANPVFIPLGACLQAQYLSRLAPACKPSIYPAWRLPTNPAFIPLGAPPFPQIQVLSRLATIYEEALHSGASFIRCRLI